jgi:hypothetical protein
VVKLPTQLCLNGQVGLGEGGGKGLFWNMSRSNSRKPPEQLEVSALYECLPPKDVCIYKYRTAAGSGGNNTQADNKEEARRFFGFESSCLQNHTGPLCAVCDTKTTPGLFKVNGYCEVCDDGGSGGFSSGQAAVVSSAVVGGPARISCFLRILAFLYLSQTDSSLLSQLCCLMNHHQVGSSILFKVILTWKNKNEKGSFMMLQASFLDWLQMTAILLDFPFEFPDPTLSLLKLLGAVSNLQVQGFACATTLPYTTLVPLQVFLVLLVVAAFFVFVFVQWLVVRFACRSTDHAGQSLSQYIKSKEYNRSMPVGVKFIFSALCTTVARARSVNIYGLSL